MKKIFNKNGRIADFLMSVFLLIAILELVLLVVALPRGFIGDPVNGIVELFNPQTENEEIETIYEAVNVTTWEAMQSNVLIKLEIDYKINMIGPVRKAIYQGSGVIYNEDSTKYYVITNNHVLDVSDEYSTYHDVVYTYNLFDYLGNKYAFSIDAMEEEYDLAVINFSKGSVDLPLISMELETNPDSGERVIAIGQPEGQINAVSLGNIIAYQSVTSGVLFDCIISTVRINNGSSGGMLINYDGVLLGINTYGDDEGESAASVPIEKVKEFLVDNSLAPSS